MQLYSVYSGSQVKMYGRCVMKELLLGSPEAAPSCLTLVRVS